MKAVKDAAEDPDYGIKRRVGMFRALTRQKDRAFCRTLVRLVFAAAPGLDACLTRLKRRRIFLRSHKLQLTRCKLVP